MLLFVCFDSLYIKAKFYGFEILLEMLMKILTATKHSSYPINPFMPGDLLHDNDVYILLMFYVI